MKEKLQSGEMGREKKKGEVISAQRKKNCQARFFFFRAKGFSRISTYV